jgi:hypothetical protein
MNQPCALQPEIGNIAPSAALSNERSQDRMPIIMRRLLIPAAFSAFLAAGSALAQPAPATAPQPPAKPAEPLPPAKPDAPDAAPDEPSVDAGDRDMQRVAACKERALARLKQQSPEIDDIFIDVDGLTIADADGKLGDTAVKGVLMGEAYIQRDRSDRANRFLCLTGVNGEVLFTFFTER